MEREYAMRLVYQMCFDARFLLHVKRKSALLSQIYKIYNMLTHANQASASEFALLKSYCVGVLRKIDDTFHGGALNTCFDSCVEESNLVYVCHDFHEDNETMRKTLVSQLRDFYATLTVEFTCVTRDVGVSMRCIERAFCFILSKILLKEVLF